MNYVELNVPVADDLEAEILTARLADFPFESFMTEARTLKAYIQQEALADCMSDVESMLDACGAGRRRYIAIEPQDWNAAWESGFTPVEVEGRLLIRAPHHTPAANGELEVLITPRMAFGTGHHATTCLVAGTLLDLDVRGRRGLDLGSGTGVLAIVAAKRGAASVDAVDIDEQADANCRENVEANGVASCVVPMVGDVRSVAGRRYDFVLANINRNVLVGCMPAFASMLNAGGDLLMSGFLEEDVPTIESSVRAAGLVPAEVRTQEGWALVRARKEA